MHHLENGQQGLDDRRSHRLDPLTSLALFTDNLELFDDPDALDKHIVTSLRELKLRNKDLEEEIDQLERARMEDARISRLETKNAVLRARIEERERALARLEGRDRAQAREDAMHASH